jgi:hypothetical protein
VTMDLATRCSRGVGLAAALLLTAGSAFSQSGRGNVAYVATPQLAVEEVLRMAKVGPSDYVIDLGSGDGRVVITAAKTFGARGLGVDLDSYLVDLANESARLEGVGDRVRFIEQNIFDTDLTAATVIFGYLRPELNLMLRPKLLELKPGTRVLMHDYNMGQWPSDQAKAVDVPERQVGDRFRSYLFLWIVPARLAGRWESRLPIGNRTATYDFNFDQTFQVVEGSVRVDQQEAKIPQFRLSGDQFSFDLRTTMSGVMVTQRFFGSVNGGIIRGTVTTGEGGDQRVLQWTAKQTARGELRPGGDDLPAARPPKGD